MKIIDRFSNYLTWKWVFMYAGLSIIGFIIVGVQTDVYKVRLEQSIGWILIIPFFIWALIFMGSVTFMLVSMFYIKATGKKMPVEIQFICKEKPHLVISMENMFSEFNLLNLSKKNKFGLGLSFIKVNLTNEFNKDQFSLDKESGILILNVSLNHQRESNSNQGEIFIHIGDQIIYMLPLVFANGKVDNFDHLLFIESFKDWFIKLKGEITLNNIYKKRYNDYNLL